jgi:flavin-binding protein dodecin
MLFNYFLHRFSRGAIKRNTPFLFAAIEYLESKERKLSREALIEVRDILWHIALHVSGKLDTEQQIKNISNVEEHYRRCTTEAYQQALESRFATIDDKYGRYRRRFFKFEGILLLKDSLESKHEKVVEAVKRAEDTLRKGKRIKALSNDMAVEAINAFVEAHSCLVDEIRFVIDDIYQKFTTRVLTVLIPFFAVLLTVILTLFFL